MKRNTILFLTLSILTSMVYGQNDQALKWLRLVGENIDQKENYSCTLTTKGFESSKKEPSFVETGKLFKQGDLNAFVMGDNRFVDNGELWVSVVDENQTVYVGKSGSRPITGFDKDMLSTLSSGVDLELIYENESEVCIGASLPSYKEPLYERFEVVLDKEKMEYKSLKLFSRNGEYETTIKTIVIDYGGFDKITKAKDVPSLSDVISVTKNGIAISKGPYESYRLTKLFQ